LRPAHLLIAEMLQPFIIVRPGKSEVSQRASPSGVS